MPRRPRSLRLSKRERADIAQRFRELRGQSRQVDFAEKLGIAQQHVSRYENGVLPSVEGVNVYCEKLGVSSEWLLFGRGAKYRRKAA